MATVESTPTQEKKPSVQLQDPDELQKVFNSFDTNGDGLISAAELSGVTNRSPCRLRRERPLGFSPSKALSSPPSPLAAEAADPQSRPSSTLFEMMSEEQLRESRVSDESRRRSQSRVSKLLSEAPFQNPDLGLGDVRLKVVARDGFRVSMDVHRAVLSEKSRFFAKKLRGVSVSHSVEAVVLMYCDNAGCAVENRPTRIPVRVKKL